MQGTWVQTATTSLEDSIQLRRALQTEMKDTVRHQLPTIEMDVLMTRGRRCGRDCRGSSGPGWGIRLGPERRAENKFSVSNHH